MRFLVLAVLAAPAMADPLFDLPVDCEIGKTCFIEDYVDNAPEPGKQRDFACGINSRDAHKGTDIAVLSFDALGTEVRAAADGIVLRTRDSMADDRLMRGVTDQNACGNAVIVDHGEGYHAMYCHLQLGSIVVTPGQSVERGQRLGGIGLSGMTTHPHLHFGLRKDGAVIDPFRPKATGSCDATLSDTLWTTPPAYTRTGLITAGFSDHVPDLATVRDGSARLPEAQANAPLVVYAYAGHAEHGDLLTITANGPEGTIFHHETVMKNPKAATMQAHGRKAPAEGWPSGDYLGEATLTRAGKIIAHRFAHVSVP